MKPKSNKSNPVPAGEYLAVGGVQTPDKLPYPTPEPAFVHPNDGRSITRCEPGAVETKH